MRKIKEYEFHELSNIFPLMEGEEFDRLIEDIKKNGLLEPIVLFEDMILDGRNRYRACMKLNKDPIFKRYPNKITPLEYVIAENIRRRHLNTAQLDEIVLKLEETRLHQEKKKREEEYKKALEEYKEKKKKHEEKKKLEISKKKIRRETEFKPKKPEPPKEPTKTEIREEISKELKVSPVTVRKAEKIIEVAKKEPKIAEQWEKAKQGKISVNKVHRLAKLAEVKDEIILGKIDIDQKQVDVMKNIYYRITQEYRYENLKHYNKTTQKECIKYMKMSKNFIQKEVEKFGKRDINSKT